MVKELFYEEDGKTLVSEEVWQSRISSLKDSEGLIGSCSDVSLDSGMSSAVCARSRGRIALLLSGGVDSALLAVLLKRCGADFSCFCVGMEGSPDVECSMRLASRLGVNLEIVPVSESDVASMIQTLRPMLYACEGPGINLAVLYGVAAVEWAGFSAVQKRGFDTVMTGLGSEEIFAGYSRHGKASDINEECWAGLASMHARDLLRDAILARHFGLVLSTPFLDEGLIRLAMSIPGSLKIVDGVRKHCLRACAVRLGLSEEFAFRPKSAAQYGSRIDKAIERLARQGGFRDKKGFLSA